MSYFAYKQQRDKCCLSHNLGPLKDKQKQNIEYITICWLVAADCTHTVKTKD